MVCIDDNDDDDVYSFKVMYVCTYVCANGNSCCGFIGLPVVERKVFFFSPTDLCWWGLLYSAGVDCSCHNSNFSLLEACGFHDITVNKCYTYINTHTTLCHCDGMLLIFDIFSMPTSKMCKNSHTISRCRFSFISQVG